ncbi:MAG: hypothetical protein M3O15_15565, partial [Acidobacteriota bacterium]|nr:hypothetical protein [Acidobacteriota bacterium]
AGAGGREAAAKTETSLATVPMHLEDNVPIVELDFPRAGGGRSRARFTVDTGGGAFILSRRLAAEIGLERVGEEFDAEGARLVGARAPRALLGGMALDLDGAQVLIDLSKGGFNARDASEGLLPGRVLRHYQVVFDYPARLFTLARPGRMPPSGTRLPSPIHPESGFPRIELTIDGEAHGFLLDTGGSCTMVSRELLGSLLARHPEWPRLTGAVGEANMFGGKMEAEALLLRLRGLSWGSFELQGTVAVSRPPGTFEKGMSPLMTAPIAGSLAGNALRAFRVEIDYAQGAVYLTKAPPAADTEGHDLDLVGLTLTPQADGGRVVAAVSAQNAPEVVKGVQVGDKLLRIDGLSVEGKALGLLAEALRGKPGDVHVLGLERAGRRVEVRAPVVRLL